MGIFAFVKEAGEKLWDTLTGHEAQAAESLKEHVAKVGLGNPNIQVSVEGDKVIASGVPPIPCWRAGGASAENTAPAQARGTTRNNPSMALRMIVLLVLR